MAQDVLADGFVSLCIDTSLNFFEGKCRVLVEGQYFDPGEGCTVVPDQIVPVPTNRDLDCLFGAGSVLAESLKKMFCQCPNNIEIFAIPRADPAAGVAAVYTMTVTGPATGAGRLAIYLMDGDYSIDIYVAEGSSATEIADLILAAVPENFPYTGVNAAGVITWTAKNAGEVGNYFNMILNWQNRQGYIAPGVNVTMEQTTPGTGSPEPLNYADVLGTCCYDCVAILGDSEPWQRAWEDYLKSQWACDVPQCFGHAYSYVSGTPGEIIARFSNSAEISKLAHCETDPAVPWFKVAAYAGLSCCSSCDNPELSIQGRNYGVLSCVRIPEACTSCFTFTEQQQLRENAFVVTGPYSGGSGAFTSPYVFNDVTNQLYDDLGRLNATFWDVNSKRLAKATAVALATELQQYSALALYTKNTQIRQGIFGTNPRMLLAAVRAWAKSQIGILFSEFDNIDEDIQVRTDFEVAPKCQGNPNKLHLFMKYRPPVRVGQIVTTLQPKVLDNCDR